MTKFDKNRAKAEKANKMINIKKYMKKFKIATIVAVTCLCVSGVAIGVAFANPAETQTNLPISEPAPSVTAQQQEKAVAARASEEVEVLAVSDTAQNLSVETELQESSFTNLHYGMESFLVPEIQNVLMDMGYMEVDRTSDYFSRTTKLAVERFQAINGLEVTGYIDEELLNLLTSPDAKPFVMSIGIEGDDVADVQSRLSELGFYKGELTGIYDEMTQEAVLKFQESNSIEATGNAGSDTVEALYSSDIEGAYEDIEGDEELIAHQNILVTLGYLDEVSGENDSVMKQAVMKFQNRHGLIADGTLGSKTIAVLTSEEAQPYHIAMGVTSDEVKEVQQKLIELGYLDTSATGYFGVSTDAAVREFQEANNLEPDGKVGEMTLAALNSSSAIEKEEITTTTPTPERDEVEAEDEDEAEDEERPEEEPEEAPEPEEDEEEDSSSSPNISGANVASLVEVAKSTLGADYQLGAKGPNSFDCSGHVYWCLNQIGMNVPYMTSTGWRNANYPKIDDIDAVQAGDIIVFSPTHVGIAISSTQMIDASTSEDQIRVGNLEHDYWQENFICAFRLF